MKAVLLATICLFAVAATAPAFAQSNKSCTTTCSGSAKNGGSRTCTKTCSSGAAMNAATTLLR